MKKYISKITVVLLALTMVVAYPSCDDDDNIEFGSVTSEQLDALIVEAQGILEANTTSLNPGDYQPAALTMIRKALDKAIEIQTYAYADDQLEYGYNNLKNAIDKADKLRVAVAMPWIQQEDGTNIQISDNIKEILGGAFTVEMKFYVPDLRTKGYSNNLFSVEQPGPDRGFAVRYFSDGKIQVVIGTGSGWPDTGDQAGAGTIITGEWIDLAVTNDGSRQVLYINGAKLAENEGTPVIPEHPFIIGNSPEWQDRVCNVVVNDFRVWNSVLDESVINSNRTAQFDGSEDGLECYFPFNVDLGSEFKDMTGKCTATINGKVDWVAELPAAVEIVLDYTSIDEAIANLETLKSSINEGENDGDNPVGTLDYVNNLIVQAEERKANAIRQSEVDDFAASIEVKIAQISGMFVGDSNGIFVDRDDPNAVGLRITPNYTPQGDYTVEFEVNVKSLYGYANADLVNNGQYGVWVFGYEELTEENILNAGGLRNFTRKTDNSGWETGPTAPALTIDPQEWYHIAVVHHENLDGQQVTIMYVDGVETGRDYIGVPAESGWGETWLGNGWGKMNGYIKNFRLWDEARTDLNAGVSGNEENLRMYFPLDRVKGVVFKDETGNYDAEMRGISWNTPL
ncbi:LamG domain-containing protein [Marinifilum sp.]|uniref:LamG domain-containing protein n=1 Tax=Marinifilum sp. TaxID=2033137 RepID=UPI003BACA1A9